jgi:hypothetical protein
MLPLFRLLPALVLFAWAVSVSATAPARADVAPTPPTPPSTPQIVEKGPTTLALSGLVLDLPKPPTKTARWSLSSSWALSNQGTTFDGRDVIDLKDGDKLLSGTWIHAGYFDAGGCDKVVASAAFDDKWTSREKLFGAELDVSGGLFTFEGSLGKVPAIALCAHREGRKDLLVYHFFIAEGRPETREAMLKALPKLAIVQNAYKAWRNDRVEATRPRTLAHVRNRGDVAPVRPWKLPIVGIDVTLPDDGQIWLTRGGAEGEAVDWFDRMAPALPEIEVEVAWIPDVTCAQLDTLITAEKRAGTVLRNLPNGWVPGPTLVVDGRLERTGCHARPSGVLIAGVFITPDIGKVAEDGAVVQGLLDALAAAVTSR